LSKQYGNFDALQGCSLDVEPGEILGLLGPNGAGKTTLLRLLVGMLRPSQGTATIKGLDCYRYSRRVRRHLTYLPGDAHLFRQLNARQTIRLFSRLRPDPFADRATQLANQLQLDLERRVGQMSTGMRQQLALVLALAPATELTILDEPTANLDPSARERTLQLVRDAGGNGRTVLFSSHVLSEVEQTCTRVAILCGGKLVENVAMNQVRRSHLIRVRLQGALIPLPASLTGQVKLVEDATPLGDARPAASHESADRTFTFQTSCELASLLGWLAQQPLAEIQIEPAGLKPIYQRHHPWND
jgi:ABC-2 type transport system ATP-binding protein